MKHHSAQGQPQGAAAGGPLLFDGPRQRRIVVGDARGAQHLLTARELQQPQVGIGAHPAHALFPCRFPLRRQPRRQPQNGGGDDHREADPPVDEQGEDRNGRRHGDIADQRGQDVHRRRRHEYGSAHGGVRDASLRFGREPAQRQVHQTAAEAPMHRTDDPEGSGDPGPGGHSDEHGMDQPHDGEDDQSPDGARPVAAEHRGEHRDDA